MMEQPASRIGWMVLLLPLVVCHAPAAGQDQKARGRPYQSPTSLSDPRLEELRQASATWEDRRGPRRSVVDMVCLVPDVPTFLEALAAWDEEHYFPILLDDAEYTLKFLHAFRPARVVRYPSKAQPIEPEQLWDRAVAAVGRTWAPAGTPEKDLPAGDQVPKGMDGAPQGVVISAPDSPALAGAAALAAGRFQPLIRWTPPKHYGDILSSDEADELARGLEQTIADRIARYDQLGDDCDFLTLAGDYPYRFHCVRGFQPGMAAFDDLIGRRSDSLRRWAYAGRLQGDPTASVYRAMCSLFLQPNSALLFNKYDETGAPWSEYAMRPAATTLNRELRVVHRAGDQEAGVTGWHEVFDPLNHFDLVLINSSGSPTMFNLRGGPGQTGDVPFTGPAAVLTIHSFSAADPADPSTLAGRWLANGAFLYFGSMNEPYLNSFRPPELIAALIAARLPLGAVMRMSPRELAPFALPWRLHLLGDPLYRIDPELARAPRARSWDAVSSWPAYRPPTLPTSRADDYDRLVWCLQTAILQTESRTRRAPAAELPARLLQVRRDRLERGLRPLYDALLVDVLIRANRLADLHSQLAHVPEPDRSPVLRRSLETVQMVLFQRALAANQWLAILGAWDELVRSGSSVELKEFVTQRVASRASEPTRLHDWQRHLRNALRDLRQSPASNAIEAELKRIQPQLEAAPARTARSPRRSAAR